MAGDHQLHRHIKLQSEEYRSCDKSCILQHVMRTKQQCQQHTEIPITASFSTQLMMRAWCKTFLKALIKRWTKGYMKCVGAPSRKFICQRLFNCVRKQNDFKDLFNLSYAHIFVSECTILNKSGPNYNPNSFRQVSVKFIILVLVLKLFQKHKNITLESLAHLLQNAQIKCISNDVFF